MIHEIDAATISLEDAEEFFSDEAAADALRRARWPGEVENPYPLYRQYREQGGFVEGDIEFDVFGGPFSVGAPLGERPVYTAVRYDEVAQVISHHEQFSSTLMELPAGLGRTMLVVDPPEHRRLRNVIQSAFGRRAMERWGTDVIEPLVATGLDAIVDKGGEELMTGFIYEFPLNVISRMLGLRTDQLALLQRLSAGTMYLVRANPLLAFWAFQRIGQLFAEAVEERRSRPTDDVISHLCAAEVEGESLTTEEVVSFLRLLLPAGYETSYRGIGSMLIGLLTNRDQLAMVEADPSLIPRVVEESLRWEPPTNGPARLALQDVEINGFQIPAGVAVQVSLQSACHDERRFGDIDPDLFDVRRTPEPHIAFGYGPHLCLGVHLAKMEMQAALAGFLDRLPGLRLDPEAPAPKIVGTAFRGPTELFVTWGDT